MRICAVILAAGRSERFGPQNKLLADAGGETVLGLTVRAAVECIAHDTVLVAGTDHAKIRDVLGGQAIRVIVVDKDDNETGSFGLGDSVARAVKDLSADVDGVLIVPVDMPGLRASFLNEMISAFVAGAGQYIVHAVNSSGEQRNPVLWPRRRFVDLIALTGDRGGKHLIGSDPLARLTVFPEDDQSLEDIDTVTQLRAFKEMTQSMGSVKHVLFLCTHNSCRSVIAESILNDEGSGRFQAHSAGSHPSGRINPGALDLLQRKGYPAHNLRSKTWDEFAVEDAPRLDFIVTVCADAEGETCPVWPGHPTSAHWGVADPSRFEGTDGERQAAFDETHRLLYERIKAFIDLPFDGLDPPTLKQRLRAIGSMT